MRCPLRARRTGKTLGQPGECVNAQVALLRCGVPLFEYLHTLLHQKVMTVDGVWSDFFYLLNELF